jgi:hypothetical protein
MVTVQNERIKLLCLRLIKAEIEDEVVTILKEFRYWEDRSSWIAYGNVQNNRSIVGNQQNSAIAALVEKIVNSIDAVLTCECYRANIEPTCSAAPLTMKQAVERFFRIREGYIQNLDAAERTRLAEKIRTVACGTKENPAYVVIDDGEGQSPDQFPNTFLSLLRENKTRIPFVQGKFNMGGTGVLQFTGQHSFQLILSRRQPDIPPQDGSNPDRNTWGFTLTRRMPPDENQPSSTYVYLAPGGSILSFSSESLPLLPGNYPQAYAGAMSAGTYIKLWNYKLPGRLKTLATLDLRYAFERYLQDPALPLRIQERRQGYRAHYFDTTVSGLYSIIADNPEDIEQGMDTGSQIVVPDVGTIGIRIVVIKELGESKKYPSGIFFNVNGQLHGEIHADVASRRTKLEYIGDSLIVTVDCTNLPQLVREDLFMNSRDRMRECDERFALENSLYEYLKEHPGLREINARRRQQRISSAGQKEVADVIKNLLRNDPTLAALFGVGEQIRVPTGPVREPTEYVGRQFPTYFRIRNEPRAGLIKRCPRNHTCRVEFETDANNDYFSRINDPGHIEIIGAPTFLSHHLWNGKAVLRFSVPAVSNPGDRLGIRVIVNDISRVDPIESQFSIEVEPDAPPYEPGGPTREPSVTLFAIPNIIEVRRSEWHLHNFNEKSALKINISEDETLDLFVNMDNLYLLNEIAKRRTMDPEVLKHWFKYGLFLLAMGILYQERQKASSMEEVDKQKINEITEGLAVTIIPIISQLGRA